MAEPRIAVRPLRAGGFEFETLQAGSRRRPLVLLLHGFPQGPECWRTAMERIAAAGYHAVAPAQRGYSPGARPGGTASYRVDALLDDVLAMADALGAERFHVVGHDLGGLLAWVAGASVPERLASLTSVSTPHPAAVVEALPRSLQGLRSAYIPFLRLPVLPERVLLAGDGAVLRRLLLAAGLSRAAASGYVERMLQPGALTAALSWYRAFGPELARTGPVRDVPTLYLYGEGDVALDRAAADGTGRHVQAPYRFEVIPRGGHWLPEQHGRRLASAVLSHLADTRGR